jgi:hypothetical protein
MTDGYTLKELEEDAHLQQVPTMETELAVGSISPLALFPVTFASSSHETDPF